MPGWHGTRRALARDRKNKTMTLQTRDSPLDDGPENTLYDYVRAFESLDADRVMTFYHMPCIFIAPMGISLISNADAVRGMAMTLIEHARRQNYRRSAIQGLKVKRMADNIATLAGVFLRFDSSEQEITRFGFAYTMFHDGNRWKIAVGVAHDPPPVPGKMGHES